MPVSLGTTTIAAIYLGTTSITSAYLGNTQVFGGSFTPLSLFSGGAQGIWLDPSDLSTMFSDRAGTTPVTTPGTVVGLRLDKSKGLTLGAELVTNGDGTSTAGWDIGAGLSALISESGEFKATANGGVSSSFSRLVTLVVGKSYFVSVVVRSPSANSVTNLGRLRVEGGLLSNLASQVTVEDQNVTLSGIVLATGTSTRIHVGVQTAAVWGGNGDILYADNISVRELQGNHAVAPTDAARPTYGVEPKGGRRNLLLATDTLATQSLTVTAVAHTLAFTGTGTVTLTGASTAGPLVGTGAGNRVSLTFTPTAASLTLTVSGSVTLGQLELGSSATAYQKVVTAYNVTESGVATTHYVQYDGSDASMSTAAIDFSTTDKMSVFAGVRKLSDAATGSFVELTTAVNANNGAIGMFAPLSVGSADYCFRSRGTVLSSATFSNASVAAPNTSVVSGFGDISGDVARLRVNGTQVAEALSDQGTGNYSASAIYIGRRGGSSLPFNGRDYGIIVVGKAATAGEITDTETWLAAKTSGVTI